MNDLNERVENAGSNWQKTQQGGPGNKSWGCFTYGDAPPAIGGGIGTFIWFSSRNEMLNFISETLPYEPPGPTGTDLDPVISETQSIVESMKNNMVDDLNGITALNNVLKGFSQIEWMGEFQELLTAAVPYLRQVRSAFRGNDDNTTTCDTPIQPEQEADFRSFLNEWGY